MPDIESQFFQAYRDRGLVVVGIDPGGSGGTRGLPSTDDIGGLQTFTSNLGVTYPVGLEETTNYLSYTANFQGANPFPIDVVVDKNGIIQYVAREYDPVTMTEVIERLLDE